jgi:RNA polymerase sigma-70 factor, ECF subfamily
MAVPWIGYFMLEQSLLRQLIKEAKSGDAAAFERIIIVHERMVLRLAQRLLLNREDAKDAAQEVFIRLHRNLSRFQEEKDFGPWLYRMTVNICRDSLRRSPRGPSSDLILEIPDRALDPEQSLLLAQRQKLVLSALESLSAREREVIVLRDLEGCSTSEVAQALRISEATVRSQISTARVKIKRFVMTRFRRPT